MYTGRPTKDFNTINKRVTKIALLKTKQPPAQTSHTTTPEYAITNHIKTVDSATNPKQTAIDTTTMLSAVDIDVDLAEHTVTAAEPAQKGTTRGANTIPESPQRRSAAVSEHTASVTPQKNDRTQGNQKKRRSSNSIKNWLRVLGDKPKDATVKELEQVDPLGAK